MMLDIHDKKFIAKLRGKLMERINLAERLFDYDIDLGKCKLGPINRFTLVYGPSLRFKISVTYQSAGTEQYTEYHYDISQYGNLRIDGPQLILMGRLNTSIVNLLYHMFMVERG